MTTFWKVPAEEAFVELFASKIILNRATAEGPRLLPLLDFVSFFGDSQGFL